MEKKHPKDMTFAEALEARSDPYYTDNAELMLDLRDRLAQGNPAFHAMKGIDPDYEVPAGWQL